MNIRPLLGYIGGAALLLGVLIIAALLPFVFAGEAPPDSPDGNTGPPSAPPMSRNERVELVGIHMDYAAEKLGELPDWMRVRLIPHAEIEPERLSDMYSRYGGLMEALHIDRDNRGVIAENPGALEPEQGFSISGNDSVFYSFSNREGQIMRVWHIYARMILSWNTWVNMYMDVDTGEIYFFYLSSDCLGDAWRKAPANSVTSLNAREVSALWGELSGLVLAEFEPQGGGTILYLSTAGEVRYSLLWRARTPPNGYDLMLTMLQS